MYDYVYEMGCKSLNLKAKKIQKVTSHYRNCWLPRVPVALGEGLVVFGEAFPTLGGRASG